MLPLHAGGLQYRAATGKLYSARNNLKLEGFMQFSQEEVLNRTFTVKGRYILSLVNAFNVTRPKAIG